MSNVDKLPDSYAKAGSNNYKLLNLNEQAIADAKADLQAIFDALDLQKATGHTLDLYGEMVGQQRGILNDIQYRIMILTRVGINTVQGDYPTVIRTIAQIFNCAKKDVVLRDAEKPCTVELVTFPLAVLIDAGFTSRNAVELIESLLPIGVTIDNATFDGTFEFAETADEYDETAGFADLEQTIGGSLGLYLDGEAEDTILPF
jgi:hypothetical protein